MMVRSSAIAALLLSVTAFTSRGFAQAPTHIDGLGSLSFPNSGTADAQHDFVNGVLLLHSFEYQYAAEAFRRAQEIDPDFALAYWGEAMTHTHPVWNEKDTDAAREALNRYAPSPARRAAKAPSDRERAYLAALDVLYGDGEKAHLDTLYSLEMEKLATAYPDDLEAQLFYALSLLGLSQGDRNVPTYMEAGAIALRAFELNRNHPWAAHYVIHSFDDPTHAILAMPAARAYGPMAPDAGHAQHMTSHIFLARGMWNDVVEANVRADAVTDRNLAAIDLPPTDCGHYNEWLMYGYQQQGRYEDARRLLMGCFALTTDDRLPEGRRRGASGSYVYMRNLHLADTRVWDGDAAASQIDASTAPMYVRLMQAWGNGMTAIHLGNREEAERDYAFLIEHGGDAGEAWESPYVPVWRGTLNAQLLAHAGDLEAALASAREAAEYEASLPVDFGPPIAFKPARELEGELLIALNRPTDAMDAFRMALARTPNRILSLIGYARAADSADRADIAKSAYRELTELLADADPAMAEALEAYGYLAEPTEEPGR